MLIRIEVNASAAAALAIALVFAVPLTRQQSALKRAALSRRQYNVDGAIRHLAAARSLRNFLPAPDLPRVYMGMRKIPKIRKSVNL